MTLKNKKKFIKHILQQFQYLYKRAVAVIPVCDKHEFNKTFRKKESTKFAKGFAYSIDVLKITEEGLIMWKTSNF